MWVCFKDTVGIRQRVATDIKRNTVDTSRLRKRIKSEYDQQGSALPKARQEVDRWENWVPAYLKERYKSQVKMEGSWTALSVYLDQIDVRGSLGLNYGHVADYIAWRVDPMRSTL